MIKVLQVAEAWEGGVRRHLRDLMFALDPDVVRCELAVSCGREPLGGDHELAEYPGRGVPVHVVPLARGVAPLADLIGLARLVRLVRRARPDLIHAHSSKAGYLARWAGVWCGVPVVYTPHAFAFLMTGGARRSGLYRWLEAGMVGRTAALIAVSSQEADEARRLGFAAERVQVIRNGVAAADAAPAAVRDGADLTVGFFGRLTRQKGADLFLQAAALVAAHVPHTRFRMFGNGPEAGALRALAEELGLAERVHFEGECPQESVADLLREVDVVAVPSRWEGCPYAVLEAQRAGVPVVAAAVGGVPDLIRDGSSGLLTEPENAEALGDAILSLLRSSQRRRELAEGGRASLAANSVAAMAAAVAAVYARAVQPGGAAKNERAPAR